MCFLVVMQGASVSRCFGLLKDYRLTHLAKTIKDKQLCKVRQPADFSAFSETVD